MLYIILALVLYTAAIMLGTVSSRHISPIFSAALIAAASVVIPAAAVIYSLSKNAVKSDSFGIWMSIICGIAIGLFTLALQKSFSENKVGIVVPIVFGGAIFLSTILSYFIFKEKVTQLQLIGLIILAIGFSIVTYARATAR